MRRAALLALAAAALAVAALTGPSAARATDELSLWQNGAHLRGADLYQRRTYPDVDGDALGPGPLGPPLRQKDFDQLARLGANLVVLSHPGIFTEEPPYVLDEGAAANLDRLVALATRADLFVVIAFRTGPGRSEFTFFPGQADTWFPGSLVNEAVWSDAAAQQGWVDMWRATAERYRDQPAVVGYEPMVEPNGNQVLANEYDPSAFVRDHAGQLVDWNQLHPRIAAAIREVDAQTPLLLPYEGWSGSTGCRSSSRAATRGPWPSSTTTTRSRTRTRTHLRGSATRGPSTSTRTARSNGSTGPGCAGLRGAVATRGRSGCRSP
ncbi:MAG: cellulase family glycosylhydrolase [Thermoleophilia bacterium]